MKTAVKIVSSLFGIFVFIAIIGYYKSGSVQGHAYDVVMSGTYQKVIDDSIEQYNIVKRNGSATERYVHAGMVCAAYLQANDEANYTKWKQIEKEDAKAAGMPEGTY